MRRQDRELDSASAQLFQGLDIHRGFRKPNAFRVAAETMLKIAHTPKSLCVLVALIGQGQNNVVVSLCECGAMSGKSLLTLAISHENLFVCLRGALFHP